MTVAAISLPVLSDRPPSPDDARREQIARELAALDVGEVRFSQHDRMLYATDASMYQVEPIGVIVPRSIDDAVRAIRFCIDHELAILPRGGGTSLAGQCVNDAVVIDFSAHCRRLIEVDLITSTAKVEPGIVLDQLNAALARAGGALMFGPDVATSSHANLGGMIGNNSAGAHSILYGRTVENLIGLDVLLADGSRMRLEEDAASRDPIVGGLTQRIANVILPREREIEARFPKTVRRVDGYNLDLILKQLKASTPGTFDRVNLAHLVCGSEGTLAVTLGATLKLVPTPRVRGLAIASFSDVDPAMRAVTTILTSKPAAVELIDDVVIGVARQNREYRHYVDLLPAPPQGGRGAVLYVAYFTDSIDALRAKFEELAFLLPAHVITRYEDPAAIAQAWKLRKAGEPLLHGLHGARRPVTFIEDTAVNPDRLADFIADFRAMVSRHGTTAAYYAHASVGCLHIRPMINIKDEADTKTMRAIAEDATDLVLKYGGALSGEHGDGRVRTHLLERFYGPVICEAFRHIKAIFDPKNLLNPGNLIDMRPENMTSSLRIKPGNEIVHVPESGLKMFFRYEREHGFGEAVEMCNGAGVCRKMKGGTMCPSYRATLDERHATRGRGNALRLAITGQFSKDGRSPKWDDAETNATLDLCLSCKACKSECPSNVDIAKLKAEYTAQGFANGKAIPLATRMIANVRTLNRIGSAMHPIANFVNRLRIVRGIANRMLGFHPKRELPTFGQSLLRWMGKRSSSGLSNAAAPTVILYADCFTTYNEPHIGRAAVEVLEAFGYRVVLPDVGCCGRTYLSTGMLGRAQTVCRVTAGTLLEAVRKENAIAVLACEPSCLSAIKDEWLELDMGDDFPTQPLRDLAAKSFLVEQFLEAHWDRHPKKPVLDARRDSEIVLHGHCHQKALWGVDSSAKFLRRVFGERLHVLDSGCCGMAGQFGYARDHYDLSMTIGEQSLFDSLRDQPDATACAPGTSCRQQVHDGMQGRIAKHPIEIIAAAIAGVSPA